MLQDMGIDTGQLGQTGTFFIAAIAATGWVVTKTIKVVKGSAMLNGRAKTESGRKTGSENGLDQRIGQALVDLVSHQAEHTLAIGNLVKLSEETVVLLRTNNEHRIREEEHRRHTEEWQSRIEQNFRAN